MSTEQQILCCPVTLTTQNAASFGFHKYWMNELKILNCAHDPLEKSKC